jgi:hypothetical protein
MTLTCWQVDASESEAGIRNKILGSLGPMFSVPTMSQQQRPPDKVLQCQAPIELLIRGTDGPTGITEQRTVCSTVILGACLKLRVLGSTPGELASVVG